MLFLGTLKSRDIVIGFIFLVILIAGGLWISKIKNKKSLSTPLPTPNITAKVNSAFPGLKIPEGVERANLSNVNGGNGLGVATRTEVVANLPDTNKPYKVSLVNSDGKVIALGNMRTSKSGWILEYNSSKYPGYNKVVVTEGETRVLEGSF